jgi:hypothetical protein
MVEEPRTSPLVSQLVLWAAFAVLVILGVVTVLVPELSDAPEDEEASPAAAEAPAD